MKEGKKRGIRKTILAIMLLIISLVAVVMLMYSMIEIIQIQPRAFAVFFLSLSWIANFFVQK